MAIPKVVVDHVKEIYYRMAREAKHRPKAILSMDRRGRLGRVSDEEAHAYAKEWAVEEELGAFYMGYSDWDSRPAAVFALQAIRLLSRGQGGQKLALQLLRLAVKDLERLQPHRRRITSRRVFSIETEG